ncbi:MULTISPECIES: GNAT family N-acetyltransferase [unclassified Bradyrhizobium]|uniref:GNAT family N-acetyltransferase n=1 Tax=unclassified Bradyrhizobium TaxID=2631580 RepID=UPI0029160190|nr:MULTISPECIES: GNAT family N-acetyltransferase [unclassified Bradyrhizobium]
MFQPKLAEATGHPDVIHTRRGERVALRFVAPADADDLQAYVRSLSSRSRNNRFLGAMSELPKAVLDDFVDPGRDDRFTLIATMDGVGGEVIVGEARYALHAETRGLEFGLSVHDRWQGHGIGPALLKNLESRAAALGAVSLFGDTLRTNEVMIAVAKAAGFVLHQHPQDWTLVRFEKPVALDPAAGCTSLRLVASPTRGVEASLRGA